MIKGARKVLEECKITTKLWEGEKAPTINLVIDRLYNMMEKLREFVSTPSNSGSGIMFAKELIKQLEIRFPEYGSRVELNCHANYLDPSLKGLHLKLLKKLELTKTNFLIFLTSSWLENMIWKLKKLKKLRRRKKRMTQGAS